MEDNLPDLLQDYRLATRFDSGHTIHIFDDADAPPFSPQRLECWKKTRTLGYGGQGQVVLQTCTSGGRGYTQRAVKMISLQDDSVRQQYKQELKAIIKFSHSKFARYFTKTLGWYTSLSTLYIAMEYFPIGDLQTYISQHHHLLENDCCLIISQLLQGLAAMHQESFAHRDVKPQNVLIHQCPPNSWWVKLADFGLSKMLGATTSNSSKWIGTLQYTAPELLQSGQAGSRLDADYLKADMWALGIMTFFILTKTLPFPSPYITMEYTRDPDTSFPRGSLDGCHISNNGQAFIRALLRPQSKKRLDSDAAKRHAWVQNWLPEVLVVSDADSNSYSRRSSLNDDKGGPTKIPEMPSQIYSNAWSDEAIRWTADYPKAPESLSRKSPVDDKKGRQTKIPETTSQMLSNAWPNQGHSSLKPVSESNNPVWDGKVRTLHTAAKDGSVEVVKQLLKNGAYVASQNEAGWTPLDIAADNGHVTIVRLLLEKGAPIEGRNKSGHTPLLRAVAKGDEAMVTLLLEKGASIEGRNKSGHTPLLIAIAKGDEVMVRLLLGEGAAVNVWDKKYRTPLLHAAAKGCEGVVPVLLERGAALEARDGAGNTPLLLAAANGYEAVVRLLLSAGAAIEARCKKNYTPLLHAAANGNEAVVRLLLKAGALIEGWRIKGFAPVLLHAVLGFRYDYRTPLLCAAANGHKDVVQVLLEQGASLERKDCQHKTPLLHAAANGHKDTVQVLLEKNAALEAHDKYHRTPLLLAATEGHATVVRLLLEVGATVDTRDKYCNSPISQAAALGHKDVVQVLLEKGAAIGAPGGHGRTPLWSAASNGHKDVVQVLLENGAALETKDRGGGTPLSQATALGHRDVVQLLQEEAAAVNRRT